MNNTVNYSKPYVRSVIAEGAVDGVGNLVKPAAADLSMSAIMAPQMGLCSSARDLYPLRVGAPSVMKRCRVETQIEPVAVGGQYFANFTVSTGLKAPIVATGQPSASNTLQVDAVYDEGGLGSDHGNCYNATPRAFATASQHKVLIVPANTAVDLQLACTAVGVDGDTPSLAVPTTDGTDTFVEVGYNATAGDNYRGTFQMDRHVDATEGFTLFFEGEVGGLWSVIDSNSVSGEHPSFNMSSGAVVNYNRLRWRLAGTTTAQLAIEAFSFQTRAPVAGPQFTFAEPVIGTGEYPDDFDRVGQISQAVRWNAMSVLVQFIGGADDAALSQAAWSFDEPEIPHAQFGDLPALARDYQASRRKEGIYAFWVPMENDMLYGPLNRKSPNQLRVCCLCTTPDVIIRVVTESIFEFVTNNMYETPMPMGRSLLPAMRQEVWEAIMRVPKIGENPNHVKKIFASVKAFANRHPALVDGLENLGAAATKKLTEMAVMAML